MHLALWIASFLFLTAVAIIIGYVIYALLILAIAFSLLILDHLLSHQKRELTH